MDQNNYLYKWDCHFNLHYYFIQSCQKNIISRHWQNIKLSYQCFRFLCFVSADLFWKPMSGLRFLLSFLKTSALLIGWMIPPSLVTIFGLTSSFTAVSGFQVFPIGARIACSYCSTVTYGKGRSLTYKERCAQTDTDITIQDWNTLYILTYDYVFCSLVNGYNYNRGIKLCSFSCIVQDISLTLFI